MSVHSTQYGVEGGSKPEGDQENPVKPYRVLCRPSVVTVLSYSTARVVYGIHGVQECLVATVDCTLALSPTGSTSRPHAGPLLMQNGLRPHDQISGADVAVIPFHGLAQIVSHDTLETHSLPAPCVGVLKIPSQN